MEEVINQKLKGIGGWLILPTINFFIIAILMIFGVIMILPALISIDTPLPLSATFVGLFLVSGLVLSSLFIYIIYLEFKHKKRFVKFAIAGLWIYFIYRSFIDIMDNEYTLIIGSILGAIIWTTYFLKSKRVKNTFIK